MEPRPQRDGTFGGREREPALPDAERAGAAAGHGRLVTVVGDAGIGKTRVVEEFVARLALAPERVAWGRCPEEPGAPAFRPWTQALRAYAERNAASLAHDAGTDARDL